MFEQTAKISHIARLELSTSQVQKVMHLVPDKLQELQIELPDVSPGAPGAGLCEGLRMSIAVISLFLQLLFLETFRKWNFIREGRSF